MRIPTIILLSSVALSLLVGAENATPATAVNANTNTASVVATDLTIDKTADAKEVEVNPEVTPELEAALEPISPLKMKEDEKTYPVGKGIVFTKTTFFVDNNNNNNNKNVQNDNENESKAGATGLLDGLLGDLLGIDIELGGDGKKKKKKKKDPPTESPKTTPSEGKETDPDYILLYGDEGYKARPIWDQQGNRGEIENGSGKGPQAIITLDPSTDATTTTETDHKENIIKPKDNIDKKDTSTTTTDPQPKKDLSENNSKKATAVDPEGIHICLLGPCKDDEEKDGDEDDKSSKRRKIRHKQKKFLKQFRGKALKIDGLTGCPVPSKG
ncbi:hypothetical protein BGZ95_004922 [Linnemannia exigua]|uniref:Uncharacterized protein n=1 Tax=Linnemannia exigua TaxID=604196 RepID=A0AAD4D2G8_9FUNG|nr:hypothetical protein BGZ95_004922 [Linnemannia exigua]